MDWLEKGTQLEADRRLTISKFGIVFEYTNIEIRQLCAALTKEVAKPALKLARQNKSEAGVRNAEKVIQGLVKVDQSPMNIQMNIAHISMARHATVSSLLMEDFGDRLTKFSEHFKQINTHLEKRDYDEVQNTVSSLTDSKVNFLRAAIRAEEVAIPAIENASAGLLGILASLQRFSREHVRRSWKETQNAISNDFRSYSLEELRTTTQAKLDEIIQGHFDLPEEIPIIGWVPRFRRWFVKYFPGKRRVSTSYNYLNRVDALTDLIANISADLDIAASQADALQELFEALSRKKDIIALS